MTSSRVTNKMNNVKPRCKTCGKKMSFRKLAKHVPAVHYECPDCDYVGISWDARRMHVARKHAEPEPEPEPTVDEWGNPLSGSGVINPDSGIINPETPPDVFLNPLGPSEPYPPEPEPVPGFLGWLLKRRK